MAELVLCAGYLDKHAPVRDCGATSWPGEGAINRLLLVPAVDESDPGVKGFLKGAVDPAHDAITLNGRS